MIPSCPPQIDRQFWAWQAQAAMMEARDGGRAGVGGCPGRAWNQRSDRAQAVDLLLTFRATGVEDP